NCQPATLGFCRRHARAGPGISESALQPRCVGFDHEHRLRPERRWRDDLLVQSSRRRRWVAKFTDLRAAAARLVDWPRTRWQHKLGAHSADARDGEYHGIAGQSSVAED